MHDEQLVFRLQTLNGNLGQLFELTRLAQRKPSRRPTLFEVELQAALGERIALSKNDFATGYRPSVAHIVPDALRDLAQTALGEYGIVIEVESVANEVNDFGMQLAAADVDPSQYANATHRLSVFLEGLAKLDRYAFQKYWAARNPQQAAEDRQRWSQWMAGVLGLVGDIRSLRPRY
jgi:hypothetical protein